ncbi:hypothetical protein C8035_v009731 [Colletotrichum spinosum]|uniref:Uncharacterized protein n=1 Tax=Colletotrichum spinosum TaxID=1347390 RepID=A0A4R8QN32_9PEZI|nr:hypothetical protein C8035_v009731 [Colletotrichum spinosum]
MDGQAGLVQRQVRVKVKVKVKVEAKNALIARASRTVQAGKVSAGMAVRLADINEGIASLASATAGAM